MSTRTVDGFRTIPEFEGVHDVWPRGERLRAVREAAAAYKLRFKEQGLVRAVKSVDIAAAPYPVKYAFHDAVNVPTLPLISMINRMIVVQYDDWDGVPRTLVFEPTVPAGSAEAPFYSNLQPRLCRAARSTLAAPNRPLHRHLRRAAKPRQCP